MRLRYFSPGLCCVLLSFLGCGGSGTSTPLEHLTLLKASDGNLQFCDTNQHCQEIANPAGCTTLDATIATQKASVCETCLDASGKTLNSNCTDTHIACTVVTSTEPHCVVCAYDGGPIVYTSCPAQSPVNCMPQNVPAALAATTGQTCQVCVDEAGSTTVADNCPVDCSNVACPMIACAAGSTAVPPVGGCCPVCQPIGVCQGVMCPVVGAMPACPNDSIAVRDPANCCGFLCPPAICPPKAIPGGAVPTGGASANLTTGCTSDADCQPGTGATAMACINGACAYTTAPQCPQGFFWDTTYPSCGMCRPLPTPVGYCLTNSDCTSGTCTACQTQSAAASTAPTCDCLPAPAPTPVMGATGSTVLLTSSGPAATCYGVCRSVACSNVMPTPPPCPAPGVLKSPGVGADGCPLPPVCICPDGTTLITSSGTSPVPSCGGVCPSGLMCPTIDPASCPAGTKFTNAYPYCCGQCVSATYCAYDSNCPAGQTCTVTPAACLQCGPSTIACPPVASMSPVSLCIGVCG